MKIGILDWGIGGVNVMNKICEKADADIIYFSDTGFTPYGKVEENELRARVEKVINYLRLQECELIVTACNAASTVIPKDDSVIGMINPAVEMVLKQRYDSIGVAGGKRTIESEIYKLALEKNGIQVRQQVAQPLSARIESGDISSNELEKEIKEIFAPLAEMKNVLLACTHYPLIADKISEQYPGINLIDPAEEVAQKVIERVGSVRIPRLKWMTSGNIYDMLHVLKNVYQIDAKRIERNNL